MEKNILTAVESIEKCLRESYNNFMDGSVGYDPDTHNEEHEIAEHYMERAFIELLVLVDHLDLNATHVQINALFDQAKKKGLLASKMGFDDPYLVWGEKIRIYLNGIAHAYGLSKTTEIEVRDLKAVMKRAVYTICDKTIFPKAPSNEAVVHDRIEAILRCHFSDLKRKPALSKPIKNFIPDTGIPSIRTLIEYKFVRNKREAKLVVDQILADTNGYRSSQWRKLIFAIYETHRVLPEEEWQNLLKECELDANYDVVVLSGQAK